MNTSAKMSVTILPGADLTTLGTNTMAGTVMNKFYDDVIKWKHFLRYFPFVRGIHRSPVNSPYKGQRRGGLTFRLICAWTNDWVKYRDAGDLRCYRAHYDVTVMCVPYLLGIRIWRVTLTWRCTWSEPQLQIQPMKNNEQSCHVSVI